MTTDAPAGAPAGGAARRRLLERVADHVLEHGASELSLSELARAVGSNNRMLLYHFGSKDRVLSEAALVAYGRFPHLEGALRRLGEEGDDLRTRLLRAWADIAHPDNGPFLAFFFQAFGVALYRPERNAELFARLGAEWAGPVRVVLEREGFDQDTALELATGLVAAWRGLQFDLVSGTPRELLDRAYARLVDAFPVPGRS
ncbi:TetR/AcrR family transcriptional regulator [uncultured Amnibacterium sp.]|uniref:TetR/AcrR family transcriptional regulator n=1 Tax=uncultured Amnibacterium sp. TaxID=1631851 RepID=UPI0035C9DA12